MKTSTVILHVKRQMVCKAQYKTQYLFLFTQ